MGSDLRGRTSADTAYNLSLAGVKYYVHIFDALVAIGIHELNRGGNRSSFQPKYILQMIEKFSIIGEASRTTLNELYKTAAKCLEKKKYSELELIHNLYQGNYGFYSDRPLLWLWRFSTRQRKLSPSGDCKEGAAANKKLNQENHMNIHSWDEIFTSVNRDIIVDLGCGMGVSILNASQCSKQNAYKSSTNDIDDYKWHLCNYAGTDINAMMTRFANGMITRLGVSPSDDEKVIQFFNLPVETFITRLFTYPGKVALVMLQFPSPYRLHSEDKNDTGNTQLPMSANDGFMVTESLLHSIADILIQNGGNGKFLFQSKCEDVALFVKNLAIKSGKFEVNPCDDPVNNIDDEIYRGKRPKRVEQWLSSQRDGEWERAEGQYWSKSPLLPSFARTETEVACEKNETFVHRCILRVR
jgi:hypothetical protein